LQDDSFVFVEAEKEFDLVFSTLKTGRSLAASYNLQTDFQRTCCDSSYFHANPNAGGHAVFFHIQTQSEAALLESQLPTIIALTKGCKSAKVLRNLKDIPAGCGSAVLTPTVAVHVLVRVSITKASLLVTC